MQHIKQSDPRAAFRRIFFTAVDTTSLLSRLQASDMGTFTMYLSKAGGAPAAATAAQPIQLDATHTKGSFYVELALADIGTPGPAEIVITNSGGTKTMEPREISFFIEPTHFTTVVSGLNATSFTCDRTETTDNYWRDVYAHVLTGVCAGQTKRIGGYTGSSKLVQLQAGIQFTTPLGTGDVIELVNK